MTSTNIAAFTATKYEGYYPPYISINEVAGAVEITIRSPEKDGSEGSHGVITLSREEYAALFASRHQPGSRESGSRALAKEYGVDPATIRRAADGTNWVPGPGELVRLRQRVTVLEQALEPFAEASQRFDEAAAHFGTVPSDDAYKPRTEFTHGQLRAARKALAATGGSR